MEKIALIPCFEPNEKLITLVKELKKNDFDIIIVNDGSNSNYDEIFNKIKKNIKTAKR